MRNSLFFSIVVFCLCMPVFSQDIQNEQSNGQTEAEQFINDFFWYQKYLSLDNVSELYVMRNSLVVLETSNTEHFDLLSSALNEHIVYLNSAVMENLKPAVVQADRKMNILIARYGSNVEVHELNEQYTEFKEELFSGSKFPNNDAILEQIDELYARLIMGLNRRSSIPDINIQIETYQVRRGDYLRLIAKRFYGDERYWKLIYEANTDNRSFLPNRNNPNLIHFGAVIIIPQQTAILTPVAPPSARIIPDGLPPLGTNKLYIIQVGSYRVSRNAVDVFERLKTSGFNPAYERFEDLYRIILPGIKPEEIENAAARLGAAGFREVLLREER